MAKTFNVHLLDRRSVTIAAAKFYPKDSCIMFADDNGIDIAAVPLAVICFVSEGESVNPLFLKMDWDSLYGRSPITDPAEEAIKQIGDG